jgi:predicted amidohydrolase
VKVAAYQAPYLPFGSFDAVGLIAEQLDRCEDAGVEILCCPEAVIGGLAHEGCGQSPADVAVSVADGELASVVAPLLDSPVTVIVGFTERGDHGRLHNAAAVLSDGRVAGLYRKVFPGYRTAISAGDELPTFRHGTTPFGIIICNDVWYVEPARILADRGAAIIFVPTNSGHARELSDSFRARGENLPIARAVDNTTTVVVADIAGEEDGRVALGFSTVIDPDGSVVARAKPMTADLLIADVEPHRRPFDPRGVDGQTNPTVADAFVRLWTDPER